MIWDNPDFQKAYRERLGSVHASGESELRAQAMALQAETAKAGGFNPERFTYRAGAAASAMLSGYVRGALDAFDQALEALEAELAEADVNSLRTSLEQEIARRAKALPAALLDFTKPSAPPKLFRAILEQAPVKARQLLAERVAATRERVRTRVLACELPDRAIFISHHARDAALAGALTAAIRAAAGDDVALYASSELEGVGTGPDGAERVLTQLKKNRMTLSLVTPHSVGDPLLWWALGVAAGAGRPAIALRAAGVSGDTALPVRADQVLPLAQRDGIVRLLRAVQMELRRPGKDVAELDLTDLLREAQSPSGSFVANAGRLAPSRHETSSPPADARDTNPATI